MFIFFHIIVIQLTIHRWETIFWTTCKMDKQYCTAKDSLRRCTTVPSCTSVQSELRKITERGKIHLISCAHACACVQVSGSMCVCVCLFVCMCVYVCVFVCVYECLVVLMICLAKFVYYYYYFIIKLGKDVKCYL